MLRTRIAAAALALAATTPAIAHGEMKPDLKDPVSLRMQMMKNTGAAMGMAGKMAKGAMDYDPVVAEAAHWAIEQITSGGAG